MAAGLSAAEATGALRADLAEEYSQLVQDVAQPPLTLAEWMDSMLLTEPVAVQVEAPR
jgi:hypothetical protein